MERGINEKKKCPLTSAPSCYDLSPDHFSCPSLSFCVVYEDQIPNICLFIT